MWMIETHLILITFQRDTFLPHSFIHSFVHFFFMNLYIYVEMKFNHQQEEMKLDVDSFFAAAVKLRIDFMNEVF